MDDESKTNWHEPNEHPPEGVWVMTISKCEGYVDIEIVRHDSKLGWGSELGGWFNNDALFDHWCFLPNGFSEYVESGQS